MINVVIARLESIHPELPLWLGAIGFVLVFGFAGWVAPPVEFLLGQVH